MIDTSALPPVVIDTVAETPAAETLDLVPETEPGHAPVTITMAFDPALAERLPRLAPLSRQRKGRMKTRSFRRIYHDTPEAAFFADHRALVVDGGMWRVESLATPPSLPGSQLDEQTLIAPIETLLASYGIEGGVMPIASVEGRQRSLVLSDQTRMDSEELTVFIEDGTIRNLTDVLPFGRIHIQGDARAIAALASELQENEEARLRIPETPLSMLAVSHGRGLAARPAAGLAAPEIDPGISTEDAARHIIGHLTLALLYWAPRIRPLKPGEIDKAALEPVHQIRVTLRRLRSALSIFSAVLACPELDNVKAHLKTIGTLLGPARDWDVFISQTGQTLLDTFPDHAALKRLMERAAKQREQHYHTLLASLETPGFDRLGLSLALLCQVRPWRQAIDTLHDEVRHHREECLNQPIEIFAAGVLKKRLKKLPANAPIAELPAAALHELRLHAKRLRYACEFFAACFPQKQGRRMIRRLSELQEELGILNDGAVAAGLMQEIDGKDGMQGAQARGIVLGFSAAHGASARQKIIAAWKHFHAAKPFWN
ncbi:CHAD domain-containing protein [Granulibacter bethesdensis]|uniref:CHAD domain-containing protein n=1 Tax=Granulibacter bethesdensis TaxID=364410 RepID=UPI0003F1F70F|nr:CHAD domain-containing protein [Granulibacter bethesdensis]AHJ66709.1 Putative adenylate cyclase family [Granulibacter bethesdensis CGDNIH4]